MNLSRLFLLLVAGCCLLGSKPLPAQVPSLPFAMSKQYKADLLIMMKDGKTLRGTTYVDGDKLRSDMIDNDGAETVTIFRTDLQKIVVLMPSQKMAMEMPYDPDKFQGQMAASFGPEGKYELIGPEAADGVDCIKYKVTSDKNNQAVDFWLDPAQKVPMKMAAEDHSFVLKWKKYTVGPQDAALFEVPPDYKVVALPEMPGRTAK